MTMAVSVAVVFTVSWLTAPDISRYEMFSEPRISECADERMLMVTATGDIAKIGGFAKEVAAKYYRVIAPMYRLQGYHPIRTRFTAASNTAYYGLPVSPIMQAFFITNEGPYAVSTATWTNGLTAEMLHKGPYTTMGKTIDRLTAFIRSNGYEPSDIREEVYVSAPAGVIRRMPITLIRIPVGKGASR